MFTSEKQPAVESTFFTNVDQFILTYVQRFQQDDVSRERSFCPFMHDLFFQNPLFSIIIFVSKDFALTYCYFCKIFHAFTNVLQNKIFLL